MYKTDHSAVFNGTAEDFYEFAMVHCIEEAFKVKVYYIFGNIFLAGRISNLLDFMSAFP